MEGGVSAAELAAHLRRALKLSYRVCLKIEMTTRGAARHRAGALKPDLGALTGRRDFMWF